jgi:hypothetical protein
MKLYWFIIATLYSILAPTAHAQDHVLAVEKCISENSGAASVDCLEKIFWKTQKKIGILEEAILTRLAKKREADDLTSVHYVLAVSSLKDASKKFVKFSERQCDFALGASGAVASGSGIVRWSCLIQLNDWRIQYLSAVLLKN